MNLPKETGYFLWYITDLSYANVGLVQVLCDSPEHLAWLKSQTDRKTFYVYESGYLTLTMYHQAIDHLPPMDRHNKPLVDGWIPFDFRTVGLVREPVEKITMTRIPRR